MKKFLFLFVSITCFLFSACNLETSHTVRRIKSNLDLLYNSETSNYEYNWYVFKYLTDSTDELNKGDSVYFKLKGTPDYDLPEIKAYFAELRDPNLNSRDEYEATKEEGSEYVAQKSQWVPITEEFSFFTKATGGVEFEKEVNLTLDYDILDNTKTVMFIYLDGTQLPDNYFDYYDDQLTQAEEKAQLKAEEKAAKQNKKEKLTEEDEKYHTAKEYYETFYKKELEAIGDKRVIMRDLTLRLEVINK